MARVITDTNGRPPTKRVISESSSEDDTPIVRTNFDPIPSLQAKRSKSASKPTQLLRPPPNSEPSQDALTSSALSDADDDDESDHVKVEDEDEALMNSSDDDDQPIANSSYKPTQGPKRSIDESSASTTLTTNTDPPSGQKGKMPKLKKVSQSSAASPSSDDDQPLVSRQPSSAKPFDASSKRPKSAPQAEEAESDSKPLIQTTTPKPKLNQKSKRSKKAANTQTTACISPAQHNGVLFPPDYEPLPGHVKMKYNGKSVDLPPEAEEVAYFFGSMLNSDHVQKPTFCRNFFDDWREVLKQHPPRDGTKITDFSKCDFTPMFDYFETERERKKSMSKVEKERIRDERLEVEKKYATCLLDGRVEKVGNFRVEPPSLFRGRGDHPKTGKLKKRIYAEDIHINCSAESKFPEPPPGHHWAEIVHVPTASWLAYWKENINGHTKYVFLAAGSSLTGQSDMRKFEKARKLKDHIDRIRADYRAKLKDREMAVRQRATAMYLIDRFALRAGNEKSSEEEADTVGCCSLRLEHVLLEPPCTVTFDFLGKDSIRFFNKFEVDEAVFRNLMIFKKQKGPSDMIFDRLSTTSLNKHLSNYMEGLTAKVFRTYNASITFEQELEKNMRDLTSKSPMTDKMLAYTKANRQVAVLCNHQKAYKRRELRMKLLTDISKLDPQTRASCLIEESDLDEEWMERHEQLTLQKKKEALAAELAALPPSKEELEFAKKEDSKKTKASEMVQLVIRWRTMSPTECEEYKSEELAKEDALAEIMKAKRQPPSHKNPVGSFSDNDLKKFKGADCQIAAAKALLKDRDEGKETSLGTSKTNYIVCPLQIPGCLMLGVKSITLVPIKSFPKQLSPSISMFSFFFLLFCVGLLGLHKQQLTGSFEIQHPSHPTLH
ncbi:uncharacterized protein VP01_1561g1 [Puccinia sorghi]|uniref:DNA topoisomerase I n=1 Tax=Puccinia sorghi TaxID=27349 RepID=A0A0L6VJU8_9BASI|nr:uncharacterized protein VP01_1561g1 [Puccinia sorghi]